MFAMVPCVADMFRILHSRLALGPAEVRWLFSARQSAAFCPAVGASQVGRVQFLLDEPPLIGCLQTEPCQRCADGIGAILVRCAGLWCGVLRCAMLCRAVLCFACGVM